MLLKLVSSGALVTFGVTMSENPSKCWIYRDDIGAWWGIKGYEE